MFKLLPRCVFVTLCPGAARCGHGRRRRFRRFHRGADLGRVLRPHRDSLYWGASCVALGQGVCPAPRDRAVRFVARTSALSLCAPQSRSRGARASTKLAAACGIKPQRNRGTFTMSEDAANSTAVILNCQVIMLLFSFAYHLHHLY